MVDIFYTRIQQELPKTVYRKYLDLLPATLQEKNLKFMRWQDRHANLMGKILLLEALKKVGYDRNSLSHITYNTYGKPSLNDDIDFNISHSGEYILCAITKGMTLGLDIEQIRPVDLNDFSTVMTPQQWQDITMADDPIRKFFTYWVMKESVIKADSRGLSIPLLDIHFDVNNVRISNNLWHIVNLEIDSEYCAALATNQKVSYQTIFVNVNNV
jgi:4'-phosphopantetheinyl transferase